MKEIITILLLSFVTTSLACSCHIVTLVEEVEKTELIFLGVPINIVDNSDWTKTVEFSVNLKLKGIDENKSVFIRTGSGGPDCGYSFEKGVEYIVFASNLSEFADQPGTSRCTRTSISAQSIDLYSISTYFDNFYMDYKKFKVNFLEQQFERFNKGVPKLTDQTPILLHGTPVSFEQLRIEITKSYITNINFHQPSPSEVKQIGECAKNGIILIDGFLPKKPTPPWGKLFKKLRRKKSCI